MTDKNAATCKSKQSSYRVAAFIDSGFTEQSVEEAGRSGPDTLFPVELLLADQLIQVSVAFFFLAFFRLEQETHILGYLFCDRLTDLFFEDRIVFRQYRAQDGRQKGFRCLFLYSFLQSLFRM